MISHFTLLTWRIQGIRHGGRAASYVTYFISKGWRLVIRVVVCGDQATSFGQCTVLPFPLFPFLVGSDPTCSFLEDVVVLEAWNILLICPSVKS